MLKRMIKCWILVVIIGCIGSKESFCNAQGCYLPKVLFTVSYGTGTDQVWVYQSIYLEGPNGFWVDKNGDIYISDNNTQIKKFSKNGNFLFATERTGDYTRDYMSDFVVDDNGSIFAESGDRTTKFDNNGRFIYRIPDNPIDEMNCPEKARKAPPLEATEIPSFKRPALIDTQGNKYEVHYESLDENNKDEKIIVSIYDKTGNPSGSFTICTQEKKQQLQAPHVESSSRVNLPDYKGIECWLGIAIYWVDGDGNLYGMSSIKREKPIIIKKDCIYECESGYVTEDLTIDYDEIIYKYNSKGEFITQIRYPSSIGGLEQHNKVDKEGNIYCLQFHKDGMDVVKYEWKPTKVMQNHSSLSLITGILHIQ